MSAGGEFVVQQVVELLLRARPLVVLYNISVAGVRVVEFGTNWSCVCVCDRQRERERERERFSVF